jgi:hypothetical protein
MKQHNMVKSRWFLRKSQKTNFSQFGGYVSATMFAVFLGFSQKPLTLDRMLLHKSNINVTIAVILS